MKTFLVIPTTRDLSFLAEWGDEFRDCHLVVVEDHPTQQLPTPKGNHQGVYHLTWKNIKQDFKKNEWIFSRHNAGLRCYGFWKAYQLGADSIVTIDDDCYPADKNFIATHITNLSLRAPTGWTTTYPHPDFVFTRGVPYTIRDKKPVVISHGLWTNKIDLDAQTQLKHPNINMPPYPPFLQFIPPGSFFPMCSMNLAFRREAAPLMYFPPMGSDPAGRPWGYDRFDDIWAGIFAKKIVDHLGWSITNGSPFVEHRKASDPHKNLKKEKGGLVINEDLWRRVNMVRLTSTTAARCYIELTQKISFPRGAYFTKLRSAMKIWAELFL